MVLIVRSYQLNLLNMPNIFQKMVSGANIPALIRERKAARASEKAAHDLEIQSGRPVQILPQKGSKSLNQTITDPINARKALLDSMKKGGKIKKTGIYKLHKGERVLNAKQTQRFEKMKKKVFNIKSYGKG